MKPSSTYLIAATALCMSIAPAGAAIVVNQYLNLGTGQNDQSFSFDTVTATSSVLFVAIGAEQHQDFTVTFNGDSTSTPFVTNRNTFRDSYIYAFDLGDETATAGQSISFVTSGNASGYGVSVLQISNADFSSLGGGGSNGGSITVPTLAAGSMILDVIASNDVGANALTPDGLTRTTLLAQQSPSSSDTRSTLIANTTGGGDIGWTGESGGANSAIWIEAAVIPEPSTALLSGLGLVFLLRRRR